MAHDGLDRFLSWRQVRDITGLGRTTAWRLRRAGDFPDPVHISPGRVAWRERDIAAWHESRSELTRNTTVDAAPLFAARELVVPTSQPRPPHPDAIPSTQPVETTRQERPLRHTSGRRRPQMVEGQLGFDF